MRNKNKYPRVRQKIKKTIMKKKINTALRVIRSDNFNPKTQGPTNGLELSAIGIYDVPMEIIDTYIFILPTLDNSTTFQVVITKNELQERLDSNNIWNENIRIKLWMTTDGKVYEMHNRGGEFEVMGMYIDNNRDWTKFLLGKHQQLAI